MSFLWATVTFLVVVASGAPASIYGYKGPPLAVSSGYIEVDKIRLFYLHVGSLQNPATDPVVFWFQGGPGGSSMIGAFLENGPWSVQSNNEVTFKNLNWIQPGANMVFIDQPACVGFSYSGDLKDCNTSDKNAAAVNIRAIKTFLTRSMPQYKNRKFWFTGESYAGAYVPMLSALVVDDPDLAPNFAGFMVGNPVMECYDPHDPQAFHVGDTWLFFNQLYWNGYVSQDDYENWRATQCDSESHRQGAPIPACDAILNKVSGPSNLGADFDPDHAFTDPCTGNGTLQFPITECPSTFPNSTWNVLESWLGQNAVKTGLNAHITWNAAINSFNYTQDSYNMLPYYQHVLNKKPNVHILIYSGLSDIYTVPFSYSMPCVHQLAVRQKARITTPWTLWHADRIHHAGHWQQWSNGVTYATVRGAGHEVPMYQPFTAMAMFDRFLHHYNIADPK